nr:unnamed protein product [Naegleria fowleri]
MKNRFFRLIFLSLSLFSLTFSTHAFVVERNALMSNSSSSYATIAEVQTLSSHVSVLQVVVIINSVLIGLLLLMTFVMAAAHCQQEYNNALSSNGLTQVEDPLWLKCFQIVNAVIQMILCSCFCPSRMKNKLKTIRLFNEEEWREWHQNDLKMQKGLIFEGMDENETSPSMNEEKSK